MRDKQDCPNPQWTCLNIPLNHPKRSLPALAPQMAPLSLRQRKLLAGALGPFETLHI